MVLITGTRDGGTAVDYTVNASLGFPYVTGPEGHDGPVNHVLPAWDAMTGMLASTAILAAERHRSLTGKGQLVELSLADVGMAVAGHLGFIAEAQLEPEPRGRFGNDIYGTFGHEFLTRDRRHVMVLALTPRHWHNLGRATGLTDRVAELEARVGVDFLNEGDRWQRRREICELLAPWIAARDIPAVRAAFDGHGVLWGPYQTLKQLVANADSLAANPMLADVEHPGLGVYLTTGSPLRFGAATAVPPKAAPELGQHTEEVLREFELDA
jgi:2-methylfumaryl-CoA isomerase